MTPKDWERLKPLFHQALSLPIEEREAFVAKVRLEDDGLGRKLADLIREDGPGALDEPLIDFHHAFVDGPVADEVDETKTLIGLRLGQVLAGRFRLLRRLGRGGMGEVFEAEDMQLKEHVALKTIRPELASNPQIAARFKREILLGKRIANPNVCRIHDLGSEKTEDGAELLFLTMEFLSGETLASRIKRGRMSMAEALPLIENMVDGLSAAHEAGVIHRDFKSRNVILVDSPGRMRAVVTDFGLARALRGGEDSKDLTNPGAVGGTVAYMAPEQIRGESVTASADIYSLGVVMYEMVTGRLPFLGDAALSIAMQHVNNAPPPPRKFTPDLDPVWEAAILRCLKKAPEERFASAANVKAALATAAVNPAPDRARKRKLALASGIVVALIPLTVATGVYRNWNFWSTILPWRSASAALSALRTAQSYLERYDRKGNVDRALAVLQPAARREPDNAALQAALAEAYVRKYSESPEKSWLEGAVTAGNRAVALDGRLPAAHASLGMALAASGRPDEAAAKFHHAIDLDPRNGAAYLGLAKLASAPQAEQLYQTAVQYGPGGPGRWIPLNEMGVFYYNDALYDESNSAWRKALEFSVDNAMVMANLAAGLHMIGQDSVAEDFARNALGIDSTYARAWSNLGTARYFQGHYVEAAHAFENAVEQDPERYLNWGNLGDSYRWAEGLSGKANEAYQKAIRLARERLEVNPADIGLRASLAVYRVKSGDAGGALQELSQIKEIPENDKGTLFKTAMVYEISGERNEALAALGRAIRAGYSMHEISNEPELASLRSDPHYKEIVIPSATNIAPASRKE